jgi:hypothetical protein
MDWPRLVYVVTRRQRYIDFYKRRVAPDLYSPLAEAEEEELRRMEDRLHVAEIVYFRTLADAEVQSFTSTGAACVSLSWISWGFFLLLEWCVGRRSGVGLSRVD